MECCNLCEVTWRESSVYDSQGRTVGIVGGYLVLDERYREYAGGRLQIKQSSLPINFCPMCGRTLKQEEA